MDHQVRTKYAGPLQQPTNGPTVFEVAGRVFGREFHSATQLWKFVNTKERDLELNRALLAAGWRCQKKPKKKILLRTADRLFEGFMNRLAQSNRNKGFAYFVEEVVLFGSFFRREERVTDIDLCISYCRKTRANVERRIRHIMREHRVDQHKGYEMSLAEVGDFLTAKNSRFHPSDVGTIKRLSVPYKVIYCLPDAKKFLRLLAATEDQVGVKHLHEFIQKRVPNI
jgi:predicted nucleotidyltransferase